MLPGNSYIYAVFKLILVIFEAIADVSPPSNTPSPSASQPPLPSPQFPDPGPKPTVLPQCNLLNLQYRIAPHCCHLRGSSRSNPNCTK